ncbi:MAG: DUF4825 domain-containing protein [Eubacteriales bacterium]|nr:DUF4825 domain-containing protein [Eubacteriales bacterium]
MKDKIPCEMIQDLLPLYIDGLTHDSTAGLVEEHLMECKACQEIYGRMGGVIVVSDEQRVEDQTELDYLRKIRRNNRRKICLSLLLLTMVLLIGALIKLFFVGSATERYTTTSFDTRKAGIEVSGTLNNNMAYCRYRVSKAGEVIIYAVPKTPWNHQTEFSIFLKPENTSDEFRFVDRTVYGDGTYYSAKMLRLWKAQNPYVGDASADEKLAQATGIRDKYGNYTIELVTGKEPYEWIFHFENNSSNLMLTEATAPMNYACILFALTGNVDVITFDFPDVEDTTLYQWERAHCNEYISSQIEDLKMDKRGYLDWNALQDSKLHAKDVSVYGKTIASLNELLNVLDMWSLYQ